jgi:hypothetical protein
MESLSSVQERLMAADSVATTLSAAGPVFELILAVADGYAETMSRSFPMWMSVTGPACEGRDATGTLPSIPLEPDVAASLSLTGEDEAADKLGQLAALLSLRLHNAVANATDPQDCHACERAAEAADEIVELLRPGT